ncbi:hypothetical protein ASC94_14990 [Massilia sp. Root418]|uniref:sensor histidine kinase n=1 Tax=Massilia sp. Root418 TaxID=1736532 RepID=UPI000701513E|nr:PAS domain-containing protein [Massilia sp. Root418]KQW93867.1 hypothetical protein ASC94_14990 [Massilia sp. Root418]
MSRGAGRHPGSDALRQWQTLQLSKIELELQQHALSALQRSSQQAQAGQALPRYLFEQSPACTYALAPDGRVLCANQAGAALLAQDAAALQGQPFERYLAPDEQPRWRAFAAALLGGEGNAALDTQLFAGIPGAGAVRIEARRVAGSGLCCLVIAPRGSAAASAQDERHAALERDNALLRQQLAARADSERSLRQLGAHEAAEQEALRLAMARTLHDEVAQNLLALRLEAELLHLRALPRQGRLHRRAAAALENVDVTLRSVRGAMNQLRPAVLELGLPAAIDWQLAEFRKCSGMACTLDVPDEGVFGCLDGGAALLLFRQLQAALGSLQRDGGASAVAVSLRRNGTAGVQLLLTDDGAGDSGIGGGAAVPGRRQRQALAMLAIGERLRACGGTLEVTYGDEQGCRVSMRLPGRNS